MGNDAISVLAKEHHLPIPGVSGEWPTMGNQDGLPFALVLVVNPRAIFGRDGGHVPYPFNFTLRAMGPGTVCPTGANW
jgi:hypothetical protein